MSITIKEIKKSDYKKAIQFAIKGMHFDVYLKNQFLLNLYGRYFWYSELNVATQVIAAYHGKKLAGVLLADIKGEKLPYHSVGKTLFVKVFDLLQSLFYGGGVDVYNSANKKMFRNYRKKFNPDGQIVFLAADPDAKIKGIGTALLAELERKEKGKTIYLYTDNNCTYQFYEHRGFERAGECDITMDIEGRKIPLTAMLYSKYIE